jgi:MFS transporter, DHA1 family, multidrug resistance protein
MNVQEKVGLKTPAFAALTLAFASFGDAFLYAFLPINSTVVGVPVIWVGLLLSINRFVRIFSNMFIVHLFAKYGLRHLMIIASLLAIASTLGYGVASGILMWLTFRICWGLSFSVMRIGTLGYALQQKRCGLALGLSKSLQETGPMVSLFSAPVLISYFDSEVIFYILALLSVPALYFAWNLPAVEDKTPVLTSRWSIRWPSTLNLVTLVSAIIIEGILIVVLGILFLNHRENISLLSATALAAFYLAYRRVCAVALSSAGGWLADKFGLNRIFNISIFFIVAGLFTVVSGWIGTGAVLVFTFYSINAAITPGSAVTHDNNHSLAAVAENATWRDIGAATGTLLGGALISSQYLNGVLTIGTFVFALLLLIHVGTARKAAKLLYLWK